MRGTRRERTLTANSDLCFRPLKRDRHAIFLERVDSGLELALEAAGARHGCGGAVWCSLQVSHGVSFGVLCTGLIDGETVG